MQTVQISVNYRLSRYDDDDDDDANFDLPHAHALHNAYFTVIIKIVVAVAAVVVAM